eukprot:363582-Chlamydomonas_euryale.AAC.1
MFLTSPACVSAPLSSPRKPIALDTSMLNSGDAMHAVIAIDGSPLSASAELPARSPRLLPHAMSVRPSTEPGMRSSDAPSCRMPTTSDATVSTHMQPTMKPASEKSAGAQSQLRARRWRFGGQGVVSDGGGGVERDGRLGSEKGGRSPSRTRAVAPEEEAWTNVRVDACVGWGGVRCVRP